MDYAKILIDVALLPRWQPFIASSAACCPVMVKHSECPVAAPCPSVILQGMSYYWPSVAESAVSDNSSSQGHSFRVLMKFGRLHYHVPGTATINSAMLNLTFINWQPIARAVQVCFQILYVLCQHQ
jgi:hypothetical protein